MATKTYTWLDGVSGDWGSASNWSGGIVPDGTANAVIAGTSAETVTVSTSQSVNDLTLNDAAATLSVTGGSTLTVYGGLMATAAAGISVTGYASLQIASSMTLDTTTVTLGIVGQSAGYVAVTGAVTLGSNVVLNGGNGSLYATGGVDNKGKVTISDGGSISLSGTLINEGTIQGHGALNLGPLTNTVDSLISADTISLFGQTENDGTIIGNKISYNANGGNFTNNNSISTNSIYLYSYGINFVNNGSLVLRADGGNDSYIQTNSFDNEGSIAVNSGDKLSFYNYYGNQFVNNGTLLVNGGTLISAVGIAGTGSIRLGTGAALELAAGVTSSAIVFAPGAVATIQLDHPGLFTGTISGLSTGDAIDFANTTVTGAAITGGGTGLAVTFADGTTQSFTLTTPIPQGNFVQTAIDGKGGTKVIVTDKALPPPPTYTWLDGVSGDWGSASNWSGGIVPDGTANAVIAGTSAETVTVSTSQSVNDLTLNDAAATLSVTGGSTLTVYGGLMATAAAGISVTGYASLQIASSMTLDTTTVTLGIVGQSAGYVAVTGAVTLGSNVVLNGGNGSLYATGGVDNKGKVTISDGGSISLSGTLINEGTIQGHGALNLGPLTNTVDSLISADTISLFGQTENDGTIIGNKISYNANGGNFTNNNSISTNSIYLYSYGINFVNNGSLVLRADGGNDSYIQTNSFDNEGSIAVNSGDKLSFYNYYGNQFVNNGTLLVNGGTLISAVGIAGTGSIRLGTGAALELAAGVTSSAIVFAPGAVATIQLDHPGLFTGTISGLSTGDAIDFANTTVTGAAITGGGTGLAVTFADGTTQSFTLTTPIPQGNFVQTAIDGKGGTKVIVTDKALPPPPTYTWLDGVSGDWGSASNWSGGIVPDGTANAVIAGTSAETVTVSTSQSVNDLTLNDAAATLSVTGGSTLTVYGGLMATAAAGISVTGYASLQIASSMTLDTTTVTLGIVGQSAGYVAVTGAVTLGSNVVLNGGNGSLYATGGVDNKGKVTISDGGSISLSGTLINEGTIQGHGALNLGPLTNTVDSLISADTISLFGQTENDGTIIGNKISYNANGGNFTNNNSISTNSIYLYSYGINFVNNGSLVLRADGGNDSYIQTNSFDNEGSIAVNSGDKLSFYNYYGNQFVNNGTLLVNGGTLISAVGIAGTGSIRLGTGAALELAAGVTSSAIVFAPGAVATIQLDHPGLFTGTISGLSTGDAIDFANTTVTGAAITGGGTGLAVTFADGTTQSFTLATTIPQGNHLSVVLDGKGGNEVILLAPTVNAAPVASLPFIEQDSTVTAIGIKDTAAHIAAALAQLGADGLVTSITVSDGSPIALTLAQYAANTAGLAKIIGTHGLSITAGGADLSGAALASLAADPAVTAIAVSDTTPISLSYAQYGADSAVLAKITGSYQLALTGVTVNNLAAVEQDVHVASIGVADTGADLSGDAFGSLGNDPRVTSIASTDGNPILLTRAQNAADGQALAKLAAGTLVSVENHAPLINGGSTLAVAGVTTTDQSHGSTFTFFWNSSDQDGDTLSVTSVTPTGSTAAPVTIVAGGSTTLAGAYGTLLLHSDGTYAYTPDAVALVGVAGHADDSFTFTASDGHGGTGSANFDFYIDRPPVAVNDTATATAGSGGTATADAAHGVLTNDTDPDGDHYFTVTQLNGQDLVSPPLPPVDVIDPMTGQTVTVYPGDPRYPAAAPNAPTATVHGAYGDLTLNQDGSYSYTVTNLPTSSTGPLHDTFTYTMRDQWDLGDAGGNTSTSTIDITIPPSNHAPVINSLGTLAVAGVTTTDQSHGSTFTFFWNSSDQDGDTLSVTSVTPTGSTATPVTIAAGGSTTLAGAYGTLLLRSDGTYAYTPTAAALVGVAGHADDSFTFTASDGHGGTGSANFDFYIDRPPVAVNDTATATAGNGGTATADAAHGVLANDTDPDGDHSFSVTQLNGQDLVSPPLPPVDVTDPMTGQTVTVYPGDPRYPAGAPSAPTATVHGTYGDLTLNQDGSYSYAVTSLPTSSTGQLHDTFTYTMRDQWDLGDAGGNTSTATIDILVPAKPILTGFTAVAGAKGSSGTAVTFSGAVAGAVTAVSVYNGAATPATLIGTAAVVNGTWTLSANLAAGTYSALRAVATDAMGQTVSLAAALSVQTGIVNASYSSIVTTLGADGKAVSTTFTTASGGQYGVLTYAADRSYTVAHPSVTGQAYTAYTNSYSTAGVLLSATYTGIATGPYASYTTLFGSNGKVSSIAYHTGAGAIYAVLTYAADRSYTVAHPSVTGQAYTAYTNSYSSSGVLLSANYTGFTAGPYASYISVFGSNSKVTTITYLTSGGTVYSVLTYAADRSYIVNHPTVLGQAYTNLANAYSASGQLLSAVSSGFVGRPYDTTAVTFGASGKPVFEAFLKAGVVTQTLSWNADGSAQSNVNYVVSPGQSVTNTGLFNKSGTSDTWSVAASLINTGTIDVESGGLKLTKGAANAGLIDVGGGATLKVSGALTGSGTLALHGAGTVVELGAAASNTVAFTDQAAATLLLDDPTHETGAIQGFGSHAILDLVGFSGSTTLAYATSNAANSSGVLTVKDATHQAALSFTGHYSIADFMAPTLDASRAGVLIKHA